MWVLEKQKIEMIEVDEAYTDFLRNQIDSRVAMEHSKFNQFSRPFIGILISCKTYKYVIPLSSPKKKHLKMKNSVDFHKIDGGKYGAINFNNMFPVMSSVYRKIDTSLNDVKNQSEWHYKNLLINQLTWLNKLDNKKMIIHKAENLYNSYKNGTLNKYVYKRCCNFIKLEMKYMDYLITQNDKK